MLVLKKVAIFSLKTDSKGQIYDFFLLVQETLCLYMHWKCENRVFIFVLLNLYQFSLDPNMVQIEKVNTSVILNSSAMVPMTEKCRTMLLENPLDFPSPSRWVGVTQQGLLTPVSIGPL